MRALTRSSFLLLLLLSAAAFACPVCGRSIAGQDNQDAYIWMTVMMCLVPVSAIGAIVLWLKLAVREGEQAERVQTPEAPVAVVEPQNAP